jgi:hypothetical protein
VDPDIQVSVVTTRERINKVASDMADGALTPDMAREALILLTALWGNCADDYREAELAYKPVLLTALQGGGAANRARMEAECSPEYARLRQAKDTTDLVKQLIVTCRAYLRSLDEEMRLAR